jgi:hypothetical protein
MTHISIFGQLNVQAGVNSSSVSFSVEGFSIETSSLIGFHAGVNYTNKISNSLYLTPGLLFSQKGGSLEFDFGGSSEESKIKLNYVDIPVIFSYQSNPEKGFFAEGGPYFGILLSADADGEDVKEDFSSLDIGLGLGVGYDLGQFKIGVRYNLGLTDLNAEPGEEEGSAKLTVLQLFGAYKF